MFLSKFTNGNHALDDKKHTNQSVSFLFVRLVDELGQKDDVGLGHMSCMNNNDTEEQDITFLYKLASGSCNT